MSRPWLVRVAPIVTQAQKPRPTAAVRLAAGGKPQGVSYILVLGAEWAFADRLLFIFSIEPACCSPLTLPCRCRRCCFCSTKVAGDQLRRDMTGLLPGSVYFFRVAGVNRMGQGPWSEMTDMVRPEPRVLHTPTNAPMVRERNAPLKNTSLC